MMNEVAWLRAFCLLNFACNEQVCRQIQCEGSAGIPVNNQEVHGSAWGSSGAAHATRMRDKMGVSNTLDAEKSCAACPVLQAWRAVDNATLHG